MSDGQSPEYDPGQTKSTVAVPDVHLPQNSALQGHSLDVGHKIKVAHQLRDLNAQAARQQEIEHKANLVDNVERVANLPPLTQTPHQTIPSQSNKNSR